ncbi:succinyl-CoA synthetase [Gracilibacillus boraciitolerans JCM 21714]|uniref:Succinyl-CoA synthetase n=1 Tax=Gracilibacillus boraciitolerans JCM 21714 TaxID=1298598 RepID=W4VEB1_9BACI|nr:CoA-binding protein [Gracilibacillus boraciitolerans]GAE91501.1 succinyl-CoA synthetase [Gracilibacillus boraciitolerans JCM 21714]
MASINEQQLMQEMLTNTKTIAVIGLSDKPYRTSYQIAKAMQHEGYRIIPVNPNVNEVLGEKAYDTILEVKEPFELINIFRRSIYLRELSEKIIKTDANYVWMQQGVEDLSAYDYLTENGKFVIMDRCIKVAHSVLMR